MVTLLRILQALGDSGVEVFWACEPIGKCMLTVDQLYGKVLSNDVARIKITKHIFPMAEFLATVDSYTVGNLIRLNGASLQLVCPRYYTYARKFRDTLVPTMLVARRLTDFRRFYDRYDSPESSIERMLKNSGKYVKYLTTTPDWDIVTRYASSFALPHRVSLRNWYLPDSFAAILAVSTFGRESLVVKDKIIRPDNEDVEGSVLRLIRVLLSDMAAKYFGPEYFYKELTNGLTKTDTKIFHR
jgi:hypothetical protein